MKYLTVIIILCCTFQLHSQLPSDTANGIHVGKMKYKWTTKGAEYQFQFAYDYHSEYWLITNQLCNPFPLDPLNAFHTSKLYDRSFYIFEGIYLMKDDSVYNATSLWGGPYEFTSELEENCWADWWHDFKKGSWYKITDKISIDAWNKFKGYQLVGVANNHDNEMNVMDRFIFISKPLK